MAREPAPGGGPLAWVAGWFGLADLVPYGPVIGPAGLSALAAGAHTSGVRYTGPRRAAPPVLPVQVFGVAYDVDLVLVTDHPDWHMHELARMATPEGPVWLCKDARAGTLEQSIVADLPDLEHWLPEVTVPRRRARVEARDRSTHERIDLALDYDNLDGEPVSVRYEGAMPRHLEARRNTSTMGHSRGAVLAALDLSHKAFARRASVSIAGRPRRVQRILGLVPFQLALVQTQAGFSVGAWRQRAVADGFETVHASGARQRWQVRADGDVVEAVQEGRLRTLRYRFQRRAGALELARVTVEPWDRAVPAASVSFWPPLPDPAMPFDGSFESTFVLDVNGQAGHALGRVGVTATPGGVALRLQGEQPAWVTDRPMAGAVEVGPDEVAVSVVRA